MSSLFLPAKHWTFCEEHRRSRRNISKRLQSSSREVTKKRWASLTEAIPGNLANEANFEEVGDVVGAAAALAVAAAAGFFSCPANREGEETTYTQELEIINLSEIWGGKKILLEERVLAGRHNNERRKRWWARTVDIPFLQLQRVQKTHVFGQVDLGVTWRSTDVHLFFFFCKSLDFLPDADWPFAKKWNVHCINVGAQTKLMFAFPKFFFLLSWKRWRKNKVFEQNA